MRAEGPPPKTSLGPTSTPSPSCHVVGIPVHARAPSRLVLAGLRREARLGTSEPFGCQTSAFPVSPTGMPLRECSPACRGAPRSPRWSNEPKRAADRTRKRTMNTTKTMKELWGVTQRKGKRDFWTRRRRLRKQRWLLQPPAGLRPDQPGHHHPAPRSQAPRRRRRELSRSPGRRPRAAPTAVRSSVHYELAHRSRPLPCPPRSAGLPLASRADVNAAPPALVLRRATTGKHGTIEHHAMGTTSWGSREESNSRA